VYVDDMLIASNSLAAVDGFKQDISRALRIKDLGEVKYILGIQLERNKEKRITKIHQHKFFENVLRKFKRWDVEQVSKTPLEAGIDLIQGGLEIKAQVPYRES
jgi:hypothetical protein